jgi:hypothetical protein
MLNSEGLDQLFQHILATAALSEDYRQRQLGPIHFLKYAYLADLAYAERKGEAFTGVDWRFYHFGPWSQAAFDELPTALEQAHAIKSTFPSRYEGDFVRYGIDQEQAENLIRRTEHVLPFVISNAVSQAVHEHGSDTADLLRRVYLTRPMLCARPGQMLDLGSATEAPSDEASTDAGQNTRLSKSKKKSRAALIERARTELARRLALPSSRVAPVPAPRYDDVFREGTALLDRLAGEPPDTSEGELTFDESIWLSDQRRDPDVP